LLASEYCHAISVQHGFSLVRVIATEAELLTLAVQPLNQKKGLGRGLLEQTVALAVSLGAKKIFLEVAADNVPAIGLYTSSGFDVIGRRPRYYPRTNSTPIEALVMSRALS
ncbi:MAG: GNAT family N-acetyltransferase, partial [Paracoccaceae bacterium]